MAFLREVQNAGDGKDDVKNDQIKGHNFWREGKKFLVVVGAENLERKIRQYKRYDESDYITYNQRDKFTLHFITPLLVLLPHRPVGTSSATPFQGLCQDRIFADSNPKLPSPYLHPQPKPAGRLRGAAFL